MQDLDENTDGGYRACVLDDKCQRFMAGGSTSTTTVVAYSPGGMTDNRRRFIFLYWPEGRTSKSIVFSYL